MTQNQLIQEYDHDATLTEREIFDAKFKALEKLSSYLFGYSREEFLDDVERFNGDLDAMESHYNGIDIGE